MNEIDFEKFHVGMSLKEVVLSAHRSEWKQCFIQVSRELEAALGDARVQFHHIGSTSIPTIRAKPILDVLGVAHRLAEFDGLQAQIEKCGYICKGEYGISGRRYCVKYNGDQTSGLAHLRECRKFCVTGFNRAGREAC